MDLRDKLAVQRTILANQRTLLSFFTASLAIAVTGATLIRFFKGHWAHWMGWALLPCAVIFLMSGFKNYFSHRKSIERAYKTE
jgi:putative membrane protein